MKAIEYEIVYFDNKKESQVLTCEGTSIINFIQEYLEENGEEATIFIQSKPEKYIKDEIARCYKSKYIYTTKEYKNEKINKEQYESIVKKIKELKNNCKTKTQFNEKYQEYKKTLTI